MNFGSWNWKSGLEVPPLRAWRITGPVVRAYEERFTSRGRYLLWALTLFALAGADTRRTQIYVLFAIVLAMLVTASVYVRLRRPRLELHGRLPSRMTAGRPLRLRLRAATRGKTPFEDVLVALPRPIAGDDVPRASPREVFLDLAPGEPTDAVLEVTAPRRGRYRLRGATVRATDPLRVVAGPAVRTPDETLLVYPRYFSMEDLELPLGRRYQPGGIPLSSNTGDAIEFVGTREYREGDPLRAIHWRSWARTGQPVVKEYQEEYFCRIALILDTFLPQRARQADRTAFEASISVLASIADYFSRGEQVVDILAAGPDVYEVSAGRSLAYLDNILDVLACLQPCYEPPFAAIGPHLFEKLSRLTTVVAVLQDWDDEREAFLHRVRAMGTSVRGFVVRETEPSKPWPLDHDLGEISGITPAQVVEAIEAQHLDQNQEPVPLFSTMTSAERVRG